MELTENKTIASGEITAYRDSTYEIVSKIAYLIGVPLRIFENENEPPKINEFHNLEQNKSARIIRHLCIIRTAIERNYRNISQKMEMEYKSIISLPEYVPQESICQLSSDGITFIKSSSKQLFQHIIEINRIISDRINNCKQLFPLWLNWQYIKDLFIMPDGLTEAGTKTEADIFYRNKAHYPYQMYINWCPVNEGNILYNDKKFVTLLYQWNEDQFIEDNKVSDVGEQIKGNIYDFISESEKTVIVVDCENSDPYKLTATLRRLNSDYTKKISSIILFDDIHTVSAWRILEKFTEIPVEHILIERVKQNKSLVDIRLRIMWILLSLFPVIPIIGV